MLIRRHEPSSSTAVHSAAADAPKAPEKRMQNAAQKRTISHENDTIVHYLNDSQNYSGDRKNYKGDTKTQKSPIFVIFPC